MTKDQLHPARCAWRLATPACLALVMLANAPTPAEEWDELDKIESVNEGTLQFLEPSADTEDVHHHYNEISLLPTSMEHGWVHLRQCHENLDAVPDAQIVFNPHRMRNLDIVSFRHIGRVWVQGPTVQLKDIRPGAEICLKGESQILSPIGEDGYQMVNGPYMRRFLDGYYPMQVTVKINLNGEPLRFEGVTPEPQRGFRVEVANGEVALNTLFEGKLTTRIMFTRIE